MTSGKTGKRQATQPGFDEGMLGDHVGFRVHIARRAIRRALRQTEAGPGEAGTLPSGSISILELIARNPGIAPLDLADLLFLDPPKVTVMLRQLKNAGLIERTVSPDDGRRSELRLSETGKSRIAAARLFSETQEKRIAKGLTAGERSQLVKLLRKLQDTLL